jgi:hypothetical protein
MTTPISLPYTAASALTVLERGASYDSSPFSHHQLANWCYRFWQAHYDTEAAPEIAAVLPVVEDVDAQWELNLANSFPQSDLASVDLDSIVLPNGWFVSWHQRAVAALGEIAGHR